jgi:hypothetical protein
MVTNFDAGYPIAHHLNHTGTLVPATHWQMSHGHITSGNMIVGMAQTRGDHAHEHFACARHVEVKLSNLVLPRYGR